MKIFFALITFLSCLQVFGQSNLNNSPFKQLGTELPTPNMYRAASGAPGHAYYQQKADYEMNIELDDKNQKLFGDEYITYHNNSPDNLDYLWLQLDQNVRAKNSDTHETKTNSIGQKMNMSELKRLHPTFDGGFKIELVEDQNGNKLNFVENKTMLRVDLPKGIKTGESFKFRIKWWYNINDRMKIGGRSGYEYFEKDDNYLYTIAQFFPRMAVYSDEAGWQHKQFLGRGEFALNFGDYSVKLTVPSNHVVASTGVLQNPRDVLNEKQIERLDKAQRSKKPVLIITEKEAIENERRKSKTKNTWHFKAENVRDFAFASSRKFIWDAVGVPMSDRTVMAMSYYPKEGNPLWEKYSTKSVVHTLEWFSHYTFDYPYPVAISVHADRIGMEYPMICFNGRRPEADGSYSKSTKYGLISLVIHEVGHNYFPMIVNSDERLWTWMDEGLTSFLQFLTEQQWEKNYPSRRGPAKNIVHYMKGDKSRIVPIMTNSESIPQFGNNAYGKPATALNILRESVMGREQFDHAFKVYANRWKFKHPTPADFFRTMEDASGTDLDWFWRGWFYTNDHADQEIIDVQWFKINHKDPVKKNQEAKSNFDNRPRDITQIRNQKAIPKTKTDEDKSLDDFYTSFNPFTISQRDREAYQTFLKALSEEELELFNAGYNYYQIKIGRKDGLVMPVILKLNYADGSHEVKRIAAEIWRFGHDDVSKIFYSKKELISVEIDPFLEIADVDRSNNYFPPQYQPSKFELFKRKRSPRSNPMQKKKSSNLDGTR